MKPLCFLLASFLILLAACAGAQTTLVARVIDGDTIVLGSGERVRYIGIDAPELSPLEPLAREALEANRRLVEGKAVRLERDVSDRDRYSRLLRYVYVDSLLVEAELVRLGLAQARAYPPDTKYQALLEEKEEEARREGRGMWAFAPLPTR